MRWLGDLNGAPGAAGEAAGAPSGYGGLGHRVVVASHLAAGDLLVELSASAAGAADAVTLDRLADAVAAALDEVAAHCALPGAGTVSPSDFPLAGLGRDDLTAFLTAVTSRRAASPGTDTAGTDTAGTDTAGADSEGAAG